jgi:hypothetical protein
VVILVATLCAYTKVESASCDGRCCKAKAEAVLVSQRPRETDMRCLLLTMGLTVALPHWGSQWTVIDIYMSVRQARPHASMPLTKNQKGYT